MAICLHRASCPHFTDVSCSCPDIGSALVDWLISNNFSASRLEGVTLASVLLEENFLRPVGSRSMEAVRSGDLAEQFLDDSTALYTFVSWGGFLLDPGVV